MDPFIPVPTPTPWASSVELPINVPSDISLWTFGDDAIQVWNKMDEHTLMTILQLLILIGLIMGTALLLVRLINYVTTD